MQMFFFNRLGVYCVSHKNLLVIGAWDVQQRKLSLTTCSILWRWSECLDPRLGNLPFSPFQYPPSFDTTLRKDQIGVSG